MFSSTLPLTSALGGGVWLTRLPGCFTSEYDPVPIVQEGLSGRVLKISPPPAFGSRTVQPVARRYTD